MKVILLVQSILCILFVTSCANKQETITDDDREEKFEYSGIIPYDSCYWIYNPLVGNRKAGQINDIDSNFTTDSDTMESELLETSKQILKDYKIDFEKRYEGFSDRGSYFEREEDAVKGAKAYFTVLGNYLFSHGYKKISEDQFFQKLKYFFFYDHSNEGWIKELVLIDSLNVGCRTEIGYISLKYRLFIVDAIYNLPACVEIKGAEYLNDGIDPDLDEPINERMDMESFLKGELVLKKDTELDRVQYTHMFLFNDSKAAKIWLLNNYIKFFFDKIQFYDDDDDVNRKKLSYMIKQCTNEYGVISMKEDPDYHGPNKEILIRSGLSGRNHNMMKLIFEETDKAITEYEKDESVGLNIQAFEMLREYFWDRWAINGSVELCSDEIDLLCMFAKMEVSLNKKHCRSRRHGWFNQECASLSYSVLSDEVLEVAKKNNYYGIPNFDEVLKVIAWDREHDPQGSKFNESPFDYATLVTQNP